MFCRFILISVLVSISVTKTPKLEGRIVGGQATTIKKFPHQISIESNSKHLCGGSVINKTVIVTAAHCTIGRTAQSITVLAGSTGVLTKLARIAVKKIIPHEDYDAVYQHNDIALLILDKPLRFSKKIKPIPLAESGEELKVGAEAFVSGWGFLTAHNSTPPGDLRYVAVHIIDSETCNEHYAKMGFRISKSMLCAGVDGGGKDACKDDSGGPLISDGKLVGVVSWGIGCAQKNYPGVYAKISYLRDWIEKNRPDK